MGAFLTTFLAIAFFALEGAGFATAFLGVVFSGTAFLPLEETGFDFFAMSFVLERNNKEGYWYDIVYQNCATKKPTSLRSGFIKIHHRCFTRRIYSLLSAYLQFFFLHLYC